MLKNLPAMLETQVQSRGRKDPLRREWQPTPVFLPGECHGQRSLAGYSPWDCKESDMHMISLGWVCHSSTYHPLSNSESCIQHFLLMNDFWDFFSLALSTTYATVNSLKCPSTLSLYAFHRRTFSDWITIIKSKLLFLNKQLLFSWSPSRFFKLIQLLESIWKKLWYIYQMRKYRSGTKSPITLNRLYFNAKGELFL